MGMVMNRRGHLGGRNPSYDERQAALRRHIDHLPAVDFGMRWQCYCGTTVKSRWRDRWVCRRCGHWIADEAVSMRVAELGEDPREATLFALGLSGPEDADQFVLQPMRNLRDGQF